MSGRLALPCPARNSTEKDAGKGEEAYTLF